MHALKLALLVLPAAIEAASGPIIPNYPCPQDEIAATGCRGPKDCLYPNPRNCNHFIQCNDASLAYDMPCAANLHFNVKTRECDWPTNANCVVEEDTMEARAASRGIRRDDDPPIVSPPEGGEPRPDFDCVAAQDAHGCIDPLGTFCLYAAPDSCSSYIECVEHVAYEVRCEHGGIWGLGTVWDNDAKACVEPKDSLPCLLTPDE